CRCCAGRRPRSVTWATSCSPPRASCTARSSSPAARGRSTAGAEVRRRRESGIVPRAGVCYHPSLTFTRAVGSGAGRPMARTRWRAGLGVTALVLVVLAGCEGTALLIEGPAALLTGAPDSAREHVVAGSQGTVASSAQGALERLGLSVIPTWEKDD